MPGSGIADVRNAIEQFSPELANKPELIVANKIDLAPDDHEAFEELKAKLKPQSPIAISGATRQGLKEMLEAVWKRLHPRED